MGRRQPALAQHVRDVRLRPQLIEDAVIDDHIRLGVAPDNRLRRRVARRRHRSGNDRQQRRKRAQGREFEF
jgi:hypothetical protein